MSSTNNPTHDLWENNQEIYNDGKYFTELVTEKANDEDVFQTYEAVRNICLPLKKRFDILVSTMDDFLSLSKQNGTVEANIIQKWVRIYAKQKSNTA
jgi:hypothetical protein